VGTWDDGIYDNDGALDTLASLVPGEPDVGDPVRLAVEIGLIAWLRPVVLHDGVLAARVEALLGSLAALPEDTRAALQRLLADPEAATRVRSRSAAVAKALGGYSDGPRIDALLRFPGAAAVIEEFAEGAARRLDRALAAKVDLYEVSSEMAALGVVVELKDAGLWSPTLARVASWRAGFAEIDRATTSERGFWRKYVVRVRRGFELLAPGQKLPSKPVAPPPRKPMVLPEYTRFLHPKFGAGTLVARTGAGAWEQLEIRFDDGETRKLLARFVAPIKS
jgi:hypothetical protein